MDDPNDVRRDAAKRPSVADLLGLGLALDADAHEDPARLRARDRALGFAIERAGVRDPARWLAAWVRARDDASSAAASQLGHALGWARVGLALAGFLLGWAASLGALAFETGAGRINVVLVLALLVGIPDLLLLLSLVAAVPEAQGRRIPGVALLSGFLQRLSAARLALRWVSAERRDALTALWGRGIGHGRLYAGVRRWLFLTLSQSAALAFGLGAVAGTLCLVVFTDLAFGWSTTLDLDAVRVHRALAWLALPWSGLWEAAVPSLELVETTRFFRVDPRVPDAVDPGFYGGWWPFVVATLLVYVVFPRVVWAGVCGWRLRRSLRAALLQTPGAIDVLERMRQPLVETGERGAGPTPAVGDDAAVSWSTSRAAPGSIVCWANAADDRTLEELFPALARPPLHAGGTASLAADRAALEAASNTPGAVAVVVRGYEPPVGDLLDFLRDLRRAVGDGRIIEVLPLDAGEGDLRVWSGALARFGDPWLRALQPPGGNA